MVDANVLYSKSQHSVGFTFLYWHEVERLYWINCLVCLLIRLVHGRQFFTSQTIYHCNKGTIHPWIVYYFHIWSNVPMMYQGILDKWVCNVIKIRPDLAFRRLSFFHRRIVVFHDICSKELFSLISRSHEFTRNTKLATRFRCFIV